MNNCFLGLLVFLAVTSEIFGQDTLVVYDARTRALSFIPPVTYNQALASSNTKPFAGSLPKTSQLPQTAPASNLYPGSQFSLPVPAAGLFDLESYPVRTAVIIKGYINGKLVHFGSGSMVGENVVLTAGHVVYDIMSGEKKLFFSDSVHVIPAFNNAKHQPNLPAAKVSKTYIFKTFHDHKRWDDIALLELDEPIGRKTGWIGMAFNADTAFFRNKMFHKFSYPGTKDMLTPPFRTYNGDTLYYNYGLTAQMPNFLGQEIALTVKNGSAVPGQSGSSLFCEMNGEYYSFGVLNWSMEMTHYQLNNNVFHQFRNAMDKYVAKPPLPEEQPLTFVVYPNPFLSSFSVELPDPGAETYTFLLVNALGKTVREYEQVKSKLTIERSNLAAGIYFYQILKAGTVVKSGKIMAR